MIEQSKLQSSFSGDWKVMSKDLDLLKQIMTTCEADQDLGRTALSLMLELPKIQSKVNDVERDIEELKRRHDILDGSIKEQHKEINENLKKIEGIVSHLSTAIAPIVKAKNKFDQMWVTVGVIGIIAIIFFIANISLEDLSKMMIKPTI